jgi:type VI secretion system (T6SS) baseplate-like injector VgrG
MPDTLFGVYRATVVDNADPQNRRRLQVNIAALGVLEVWAEVCLSGRAAGQPPRNATVWVMFEAGDPQRPVWLGRALAE